MPMHSFGFKVVSSDPDDTSGTPIAVAGNVMVDVQKLLTDIGCMDIRIEMRFQNRIPEDLKEKYKLRTGGTVSSLESAPSKGNEAALESAINTLFATLGFLGKGAMGTWMEDTFQDEDSRRAIAQDLIDLTRHLEGYKLVYKARAYEKIFDGVDIEKMSVYTTDRDEISAAVGIISRDPVKMNHWNISSDSRLIPITFNKDIAPSSIPMFASAGPVIVVGSVTRDAQGDIVSVEGVSGCYRFPEIRFLRVISANGDRNLLNPIIARPGYDSEKKAWTLDCDELGASVSKPSWDECVKSFHDYAVFLFDTYAGDNGDFEGEELEIREYLLSLLPA